MSMYAVAFINFFDNELIIEFIEAEDAVEAIFKHSKVEGTSEEFPTDLENIKEEFFNMDCAIDVKEIS